MQVLPAGLPETPEDIYRRVWREFRPRSHPPTVEVKFCRFANADSYIRMRDGHVQVRITDVLEGAPRPVMEALANILVAKLLRRPVPAAHNDRYRRYLNRRDMRRSLHLVRQIRGRKFISGPQGEHYNLEEVFEGLNARHFHGLMARPALGWSQRRSKTTLGHYDPSHNAIIISKLLDRSEVPRLVLEYVVFHEMLHLRFPAEHEGARRRVHTRQLRQAEKEFASLKEAKEFLKKL